MFEQKTQNICSDSEGSRDSTRSGRRALDVRVFETRIAAVEGQTKHGSSESAETTAIRVTPRKFERSESWPGYLTSSKPRLFTGEHPARRPSNGSPCGTENLPTSYIMSQPERHSYTSSGF
jgi:hypothetical protein